MQYLKFQLCGVEAISGSVVSQADIGYCVF